MVTSPTGRIAQWNHAAELTFACSAERVQGRPCDDVLALHTGTGRRYVARSEDRYFGNALADAARRLTMQVDHTKRTPKTRVRRLAPPRTGGA